MCQIIKWDIRTGTEVLQFAGQKNEYSMLKFAVDETQELLFAGSSLYGNSNSNRWL
jgi:hypothetical protein